MLAIVCGTIYRYQNSFNAFSFEEIGPKEKAWQKENAESPARRAPLLVESHLLKKGGRKQSRNVLC
jgi:hypothetical protein